jgi:TfoX/Sxy family transcriptional regulator of competence genes
MFGEYMVYCNDKPVLLICDDTVFVKILPETISVLGKDTKQGEPYVGAKPHFILDADDKDTAIAVVEALERVIKTPQKKRK